MDRKPHEHQIYIIYEFSGLYKHLEVTLVNVN